MSHITHPLLTDYPLVIKNEVKWGEMDSANHVNNTVYFRYFEDVRVAYLNLTGVWAHMQQHNQGTILASTQCRFKVPMTFPDSAYIGVRARQLQSDRLTHEYCIVSEKHNAVVAEGSGLVVFYDYNAGRKAPIPDHIRARILDLDPNTVD